MECHPCLPVSCTGPTLGEGGMLGLGAPGLPFQALSSKEHKARTFLRSASWRGPTESGHGQSPGAELEEGWEPGCARCARVGQG